MSLVSANNKICKGMFRNAFMLGRIVLSKICSWKACTLKMISKFKYLDVYIYILFYCCFSLSICTAYLFYVSYFPVFLYKYLHKLFFWKTYFKVLVGFWKIPENKYILYITIYSLTLIKIKSEENNMFFVFFHNFISIRFLIFLKQFWTVNNLLSIRFLNFPELFWTRHNLISIRFLNFSEFLSIWF